MKIRPALRTLFILSILTIIITDLSANGILYVRPRFSDQAFEKMDIKSIDVDVNIQDMVAETSVDQIFKNTLNTSVESIFIFPLPENAMITELIYWFNGQSYTAKIRERAAAVKDYNDKLRQWMDPALLEYLGDNLFRLSIVPVEANSEVRVEITYVELLQYDFGKTKYTYLLNTLDLSPNPVEFVHLDLDAHSQNPFKYFSSPSHQNSSAAQTTKISDTEYSMEFGDENFIPDKNLIVEFETVRDEIQYSLLTYTPTPEDSMGKESFYSLWITPPDTVEDEEVIPKDIIFTVDVSSSMEGERLAQVKQSLHYFLQLLQPDDKFNIITFGTHSESFKTDLVEASQTNISGAEEFVDDLYALGLTNISEALSLSMQQSFGSQTSNDIVFFTDGKPTFGETDPDSIISKVNSLNTDDVRLFSFGVGDEINRSLLTQIAVNNGGYSTFITSDDSISILINNHFKRISKPVIKNLEIEYSGLDVWDTYPKILPDLYYGNQTMEMGLYNSPGEKEVTFSGNLGNGAFEYSKNMLFPDSGGYRFVPRLWAKMKINHLLDMIEIYGENDELIDQIIDLSIRFGVLTEYTAYYSDPDLTDVENDNSVPENFKLFQNYPNPFNPTTTIKYTIPAHLSGKRVVIKIYNALGKLVDILVDDIKSAGTYTIVWNGKTLHGSDAVSGVYFYTLSVENLNITNKMVLLR